MRLRTTLVPAALATVALGFATTSAGAATPTAAQASPAQVAALEQLATRDGEAGVTTTDLPTLVTSLLGLPGEGSLEALLKTLGLPQAQAADLAQKLSELPTILTVPQHGG